MQILYTKGRNIMGTSILTVLFLGFVSVIVVLQLVPAVILFVGMMKGLFVKPKKQNIKS